VSETARFFFVVKKREQAAFSADGGDEMG